MAHTEAINAVLAVVIGFQAQDIAELQASGAPQKQIDIAVAKKHLVTATLKMLNAGSIAEAKALAEFAWTKIQDLE